MEARETAVARPDRWDRWRAVIAWSLVAPFAVWALFRLFGLDRGYPLVSMVAFTPYVAGASLVAIAATAVLRVRGALLASTAACVVLVALVLPRAVSGGQIDEPEGGTEVTVMTANLYFGEADAETVVSLAREEGVDVLALQELTAQAVRQLRAAGLDRLLTQTVVPAAPGASGGGIYSRATLTDTGTVGPLDAFRMPSADVRAAGTKLSVVSVHPIPPTNGEADDRWRDALRALPAAGAEGELGLLLGDFNATLDHSELRRVLDRGYVDAADVTGAGLTGTWSRGPWPPLTIDHLLVDERIHVASTQVEELPGSDHNAVIADLVLPTPGG
jgi:endonuclease/exonuclease/phosphatase (EEP) superfamily protein YafD